MKYYRVPKPSHSGSIQPCSGPWLQPCQTCHWLQNTCLTIPPWHFLSSCSCPHCLADPTSPPRPPHLVHAHRSPNSSGLLTKEALTYLRLSHRLILHSLRVLLFCPPVPMLIDYGCLSKKKKNYVFDCLCYLLQRPNTGPQPNSSCITCTMQTPLPLLGLLKGKKKETSIFRRVRATVS